MTTFIKNSILAITMILIAVNFVFGFINVMAQFSRPQISDPGIEFADLKPRLAGIRQASFLSDQENSAEDNDGRFLLAQYALAPTILDLDNPHHRYIVLSCATPESALKIIRAMNAQPLYINSFGKMILERSP